MIGTMPVAQRLHRGGELIGQAEGIGLTQIDGDLGQRPQPFQMVDRTPDDYRIAEAGLVLQPVEMDPQRRRGFRIEARSIEQAGDRGGDPAGELGDVSSLGQRGWCVVRLNDHAGRCLDVFNPRWAR
jgi:hypothetical protein